MTTIVGIKAEKGKEGVVLASDLSRTQVRRAANGDVAYKKSEGQKIYVGDDREFAICMSGFFDQQYIDFLTDVINGKIKIREAVESGVFAELKSLNEQRWDGKVPNPEYTNGLLLATRFERKPQIYTCWPLGKVEPRAWTSIGSGSDYAIDYISKQQKLIPGGVSLDDVIDIVNGGLDAASEDLYTIGLDIVVVTPDRIVEYGEELRQSLERTRRNFINRIKKDLA